MEKHKVLRRMFNITRKNFLYMLVFYFHNQLCLYHIVSHERLESQTKKNFKCSCRLHNSILVEEENKKNFQIQYVWKWRRNIIYNTGEGCQMWLSITLFNNARFLQLIFQINQNNHNAMIPQQSFVHVKRIRFKMNH